MSDQRAAGVLLGLACGDALGRPVEFESARRISSAHGTLTEMRGHGTWGQPAGTVTDDTEQALCIARSLTEHQAFDPAGIADRFVAWYETDPFDIGGMTRRSLQALQDGQPWAQAGELVWQASSEGANAGNGSVMRCPPLAIPYRNDIERLATVSRDSSRITHADPRCTHGCAILNATIAHVLRGESDPLHRALTDIGTAAPDELIDALTPIADGTQPGPLSTSGYVIDSLQTALYDALRSDDAEEAIVTAVNRGGDTDTIGAITGAVVGARFGADALPDRWLDALDARDELEDLSQELLALDQ